MTDFIIFHDNSIRLTQRDQCAFKAIEERITIDAGISAKEAKKKLVQSIGWKTRRKKWHRPSAKEVSARRKGDRCQPHTPGQKTVWGRLCLSHSRGSFE